MASDYRPSSTSVRINIGLVSVPVAWWIVGLASVVVPAAILIGSGGNAWLFTLNGIAFAGGLFLLVSARDIEVDSARQEVRIHRWRNTFTGRPRTFPFARFGPIIVERRGGIRRLGSSTSPLTGVRNFDYPEHVWVVTSSTAGTLAAGQRGEIEGIAYQLAELTGATLVHRSSDEWSVHML